MHTKDDRSDERIQPRDAAPFGATAPAPLFRDPIYDGAADPTIIWSTHERLWWMLYTQRRATVEGPGHAWFFGTQVGVASSENGRNWCYRGTLNLALEPGHNTFWAPEVIYHEGVYHMFVSYIRGIPADWAGQRHIVHFSSSDLWHWTHRRTLKLTSDMVIDACVLRLESGVFRMWYKDEAHGSHTYAADSWDLETWHLRGRTLADCAHEGPNAFRFDGRYWLLTDPWDGLGVYVSDDAENWQRQPNILAAAGSRSSDETGANHADVLVHGERAFVFYHVHPSWNRADHQGECPLYMPESMRRSVIQVAELKVVHGQLTCDRNAALAIDLAQAGSGVVR